GMEDHSDPLPQPCRRAERSLLLVENLVLDRRGLLEPGPNRLLERARLEHASVSKPGSSRVSNVGVVPNTQSLHSRWHRALPETGHLRGGIPRQMNQGQLLVTS